MAASSVTSVPRIDSHQHFWEYDPQQYPWIQADWPIRKSFLPPDLKPLLDRQGFHACVAVQARQSYPETSWLLRLAEENRFIAGVVGWVDLCSENVEDETRAIAQNKLVGVRHVVQDEPDNGFMLRPAFTRGIAVLEGLSLTYDLLIFPKQLPAAIKLVNRFPRQPFVLDHIAKPEIRDATLEPWRTQIRELAQFPNVYCKLSGMVTEARRKNWTPPDFRPYLDVVWEAFGEDRLMIGSDWPVCLLSAEYDRTMQLVQDYLAQFGPAALDKTLGGNALRFYKLKV